jgi:hypothetical protein
LMPNGAQASSAFWRMWSAATSRLSMDSCAEFSNLSCRSRL